MQLNNLTEENISRYISMWPRILKNLTSAALHLKKKILKAAGVCSAVVNTIKVFPHCDRQKTSI